MKRVGSRAVLGFFECADESTICRRLGQLGIGSNTKRHIGIYRQNFPHAVAVTTAKAIGRKANLGKAQSVLAHRSYVSRPLVQGVPQILGEEIAVQIAKCDELHTFAAIPKRSVIACSFAWCEKNRRL